MPIPARLVKERTDLSAEDLEHLTAIVEEWSLLADLSLSDLVMWVPTWNDAGAVAVAHVRPTTAPTSVPEDVVGKFTPRGRISALDQALSFGRTVHVREPSAPLVPCGIEAYPIHRPSPAVRSTDDEGHAGRDRDVIAVIVRHTSSAPRVAGQLEEFYLSTADTLFSMVVTGSFPVTETVTGVSGRPRIGDGVIRLDAAGLVSYASPNAVSALRRLGVATDIVGSDFADVVMRLLQRRGASDAAVANLARGRVAGRADIEAPSATVLLKSVPLIQPRGESDGALLLLRDTTDIRKRERALLSKDATIREIHHRVKNNLQTVASLLRLQSRRSPDPAVRAALADAQMRVASIAVVHEALSAGEESDPGESVDFDRIVRALFAVAVDDPRSGFTLERAGDAGRLPADVATPLAMCVSELIHNAIQHSQGTFVEVRATRDPDELRIVIRDDGIGVDPQVEFGLGLQIVASLVETELSGEFAFGTSDYGTHAELVVPIR